MPRSRRLTAALLLRTYRAGLFPMAESRDGGIGWFSPDPRAIIPLDTFSVPRSVRRLVRQGGFLVKADTAFGDVIRGCAARPETWISDEIIAAYTELHALGYAHSVETWSGNLLAGGLYGVAMGSAFFGESMFSLRTGASKVALVALVERLRKNGFDLLDTQYVNPLLEQFGAVEIPRDSYLKLLDGALHKQVRF